MTIPAPSSSRAQLAPALLLRSDEFGDPQSDAFELLGRGETVVGRLRHPREDLADEAGDAHHEEFVEVVGGDREKAQPLEQGMVEIARFLEHPAVELQPRQFAVDEPLG